MTGLLTDTKVNAIEEEIDVCILPREWNHNHAILVQIWGHRGYALLVEWMNELQLGLFTTRTHCFMTWYSTPSREFDESFKNATGETPPLDGWLKNMEDFFPNVGVRRKN